MSVFDIFDNSIFTAFLSITISISIVIIILLENRNPLKALAWILLIVFLPFIGIIIYIIFGQNRRRENRINRKFYSRILLKPQTLGLSKKIKKKDISQSKYANLITLISNKQAAPPLLTARDIKIYSNGNDMYSQLFDDIIEAKESIHLQSYIFEDGRLFSKLSKLLIEKAQQGLRIRIIYDYIGSYSVSQKKWKNLQKYGIEIYPFMKVFLPIFSSDINYRNHRKLIIIDAKIGYIGGMNVADRYIYGDKYGEWRDTHFRLKGNIVASLQEMFLLDWFSVSRKVFNFDKYFKIDNEHCSKVEIPIQVFTGGPMTEWHDIEQCFISMIMRATKNILIETPYFSPTEPINTAIITMALSGVNVEIIIPDRGDSKIASWASDSYLEPLLKAGVKIYRYKKGFIHSKLMIIDSDITIFGSVNIDFRSFEHNFEISAIAFDKNFSNDIEKLFEEDKNNSNKIVLEDWINRSIFVKLRDGFIRLFSPIL